MNPYDTVFTLVFFTILFSLTGCSQEKDQGSSSQLADQTGINIEGAWARPGSEGRMSAAYFLISNFNDSDDVLLSVQSDVARNVEVHESYEREEGMMGMREVSELEIPGQSTVRFEQGGLHVMLIQLTSQLREGDTFELTLTFENQGEVTIEVPARL